MIATPMWSCQFAILLAVFPAVVLVLALLGGGVAAKLPSAWPMLLDAKADTARAEQDRKPLFFYFSTARLPVFPCDRQNYLLPLLGDRPRREQALLREIDISSTQGITELDGSASSPSALAQSFHIRVGPTVLFAGAGGGC